MQLRGRQAGITSTASGYDKRATEMLAELKEAKLEAQRQYLARKAAEIKG